MRRKVTFTTIIGYFLALLLSFVLWSPQAQSISHQRREVVATVSYAKPLPVIAHTQVTLSYHFPKRLGRYGAFSEIAHPWHMWRRVRIAARVEAYQDAHPYVPPVTPKSYVSSPVSAVSYSGGGIWSCIAHYESGGNWSIDTGNGYYGGLQFTKQTWDAYGGDQFAAYPNQATPGQQITIAERVVNGWTNSAGTYIPPQGYGAWPVTSVECGV